MAEADTYTVQTFIDAMTPDVDVLDTSHDTRRLSQWLYTFLPVDCRGREMGHKFVQPGMPALVRSRNYKHRSDSLEEGAPFEKVSENLAFDSCDVLFNDYSERGLVWFRMLAGRDTDADKKWLAGLLGMVLPNIYDFDDAEDKDWELFKRRDTYLEAQRLRFAEGSIEAQVVGEIIASNRASWTYLDSMMASLLAEAEAGRKPNGLGGRTKPGTDELKYLKWCGLHPSKHFDGYGDVVQPQAIEIPGLADLIETMKASKSDTTVNEMAALMTQLATQAAQIAEQQKQIEQLLALATTPTPSAPKGKQ